MTVEKKTRGRKKQTNKIEVVFKPLEGEEKLVYFEIHDDAISLPQEMKEKLQLSIINSLKHGEYVFNKTTAEKYLEKIRKVSNVESVKNELIETSTTLTRTELELKRISSENKKLQEKLDSIPNFLKNIFGR